MLLAISSLLSPGRMGMSASTRPLSVANALISLARRILNSEKPLVPTFLQTRTMEELEEKVTDASCSMVSPVTFLGCSRM